MELWIRSQDKEKLIKINNIEIQHHYSYKDAQERFLLPNGGFEYRKVSKKDKYIESVIMCNDEICLGKYNSKKRALEVLDEIQSILNLKDMYKYDRELVLKSWENVDEKQVKIVRQQMSVYEMPKE